jgi:hypothetical protein
MGDENGKETTLAFSKLMPLSFTPSHLKK